MAVLVEDSLRHVALCGYLLGRGFRLSGCWCSVHVGGDLFIVDWVPRRLRWGGLFLGSLGHVSWVGEDLVVRLALRDGWWSQRPFRRVVRFCGGDGLLFVKVGDLLAGHRLWLVRQRRLRLLSRCEEV